MPSTAKRQVILSKPADWDTWISIIRHEATSMEVWDLVNPEIIIKPACKEEPTLPNSFTIQNADPIDQEIAFEVYELDLQSYQREYERLDELLKSILKSISANSLAHIQTTTTTTPFHVWDILRALKQRVELFRRHDSQEQEAPSSETDFKLAAEKLHRKAFTSTSETDVKLATSQLHQKALTSSSETDVKLATQLHRKALTPTSETDGKLTEQLLTKDAFKAQIERAITKNHFRSSSSTSRFRSITSEPTHRHLSTSPSPTLTIPEGVKSTTSAYSTRPSSTARSISSIQSSQQSYPDCICGGTHYYSRCFYLNPSKRPFQWTPRQSISTKINEILASNPKLQAQIERAKEHSRSHYRSSSLRLTALEPTYKHRSTSLSPTLSTPKGVKTASLASSTGSTRSTRSTSGEPTKASSTKQAPSQKALSTKRAPIQKASSTSGELTKASSITRMPIQASSSTRSSTRSSSNRSINQGPPTRPHISAHHSAVQGVISQTTNAHIFHRSASQGVTSQTTNTYVSRQSASQKVTFTRSTTIRVLKTAIESLLHTLSAQRYSSSSTSYLPTNLRNLPRLKETSITTTSLKLASQIPPPAALLRLLVRTD